MKVGVSKTATTLLLLPTSTSTVVLLSLSSSSSTTTTTTRYSPVVGPATVTTTPTTPTTTTKSTSPMFLSKMNSYRRWFRTRRNLLMIGFEKITGIDLNLSFYLSSYLSHDVYMYVSE